MEQKVTFRYFYGNEADQYSFYRIPKLLFKNEYFKNLSSDAKILYGLMLDRMSLSIKNQWFDEKKRAYIFVNKETQRVSKSAIKELDAKDILLIFPEMAARLASLAKTMKS